MSDDKSSLRKKLLFKRKKLFNNNLTFNFEKIINLINKNFELKKISVAGYYPINFEANVLGFLTKLYKKGITIGLPIIKKNYEMKFKKWKPNQSLFLNKYGIPEPKKTNETLIPDIILVPLVAYDKKLNRLGYGAGYYDRALKKLSTHKKIITIGVGFSFQQCENIPVDKNDHALDYILNEKKIIYKN
jgi:5-formyltetrahydrofolate cyclo-ligase|tara:strand:+ start:568 stop:1131 length:564 start_codon:yes stop_codon:yes gene_type:complete